MAERGAGVDVQAKERLLTKDVFAKAIVLESTLLSKTKTQRE